MDNESDGTPFADPAYWRGHDAAVAGLCYRINLVLDGKDTGHGVSQEPWESTRRRLLSMLKLKNYLLEKEWSMGTGQCPECCGVSEKWLGHPCYLTSGKLGHTFDCRLASMLQTVGCEPLYQGQSKLNDTYETYWSRMGIGSTRKVTK